MDQDYLRNKRNTRQKFTPEEDIILHDRVMMNGEKDWAKIASFLKSRTSRQCRERWKNYLSPKLVHDPWTQSEDELLSKLINQFGPKWSKISNHFPGRTDVIIKNRWSLLKRRLSKRIIETSKRPFNDNHIFNKLISNDGKFLIPKIQNNNTIDRIPKQKESTVIEFWDDGFNNQLDFDVCYNHFSNNNQGSDKFGISDSYYFIN